MEREATERRAAEAAAEAPADEESVAPPLHCFSASESHDAPPDLLDQAMRDLQTEILSLRGAGPASPALPGAP